MLTKVRIKLEDIVVKLFMKYDILIVLGLVIIYCAGFSGYMVITGKWKEVFVYPEEEYVILENEAKRIVDGHEFESDYSIYFSDNNLNSSPDTKEFNFSINNGKMTIDVKAIDFKTVENKLNELVKKGILSYELINKDFEFRISKHNENIFL